MRYVIKKKSSHPNKLNQKIWLFNKNFKKKIMNHKHIIKIIILNLKKNILENF